MTELMKRYESETGKKAILDFGSSGEIYAPLYAQWLEHQLRWRPASEKPEKAGVYFVEGSPYTGCDSTIITTAYFDGESFLWHAVVRWLPLPPQGE